ncbi:hypothetical protein L7F22_025551 [Adiantum nelumboides]|nr:hypothetical protein [Adiantum nelumboides]
MAKGKSDMPSWLLPNDQEVEEWNLGSKKDPNMIKINKHLKKELKDKAWNLFLKFKDVFAWEHTDLKGVDPKVCQHNIPLKPDARPISLQRYRMNPSYAKKVKEEIDNLTKAGFNTEVESSDWLFPIVVVPKKNGKLRVCVDYRKLNAQTIKDPFSLPFTDMMLPFIDMMLDEITNHEMYSFMDGYSGYNQLKIAPEDREKTTFIIEWKVFLYLVMPFGLCNSPATFQRYYLFKNGEGNELESLRDEPVDAELFQTIGAAIEELDPEWMEVQEFLQNEKILEDWSNSRRKASL